jgi:serine phosphatase RsbU (regulator of sigma subunit)
MERMKTYLPDSFFLWMPRDIVGGDLIFTDSFEDGFMIVIADCTGHGVPGAFMTMLVSSALGRVILDEGCHDPALILKRVNGIVKTNLKQDTRQATSDDGLDAAICFVNPQERTLTFAGARLPLTYIQNGKIYVVSGNRQSLGYRRSKVNFDFTNHPVRIEAGMSFYLFTDGFEDQLGGPKNRRFRAKLLRNLFLNISGEPFDKQQELLLQAFHEYKGHNERQDDVTVIGFSVKI